MTDLYLDIGNSSVKSCRYDNVFSPIHRHTLDEVAAINTNDYQNIVLCNVGITQPERLIDGAAQLWHCRVDKGGEGLTSAYDLSQLGVDRWMVLLAVSQQRSAHKGYIIVDAGSAITVDVLDGNNYHVGGQIIAGVPLLRRALNLTAKIEVGIWPSDGELLACNTAAAVEKGINTSIAGLVRLIDTILTQRQEEMEVIFTGGDGAYLMELCGRTIEATMRYDAHLVFRGMRNQFVGCKTMKLNT